MVADSGPCPPPESVEISLDFGDRIELTALHVCCSAVIVELAADGEYVGSKRLVLDSDAGADADGEVVTGTAVFEAPIRPGKDRHAPNSDHDHPHPASPRLSHPSPHVSRPASTAYPRCARACWSLPACVVQRRRTG